jgi:hypothetical protein
MPEIYFFQEKITNVRILVRKIINRRNSREFDGTPVRQKCLLAIFFRELWA